MDTSRAKPCRYDGPPVVPAGRRTKPLTATAHPPPHLLPPPRTHLLFCAKHTSAGDPKFPWVTATTLVISPIFFFGLVHHRSLGQQNPSHPCEPHVPRPYPFLPVPGVCHFSNPTPPVFCFLPFFISFLCGSIHKVQGGGVLGQRDVRTA